MFCYVTHLQVLPLPTPTWTLVCPLRLCCQGPCRHRISPAPHYSTCHRACRLRGWVYRLLHTAHIDSQCNTHMSLVFDNALFHTSFRGTHVRPHGSHHTHSYTMHSFTLLTTKQCIIHYAPHSQMPMSDPMAGITSAMQQQMQMLTRAVEDLREVRNACLCSCAFVRVSVSCMIHVLRCGKSDTQNSHVCA